MPEDIKDRVDSLPPPPQRLSPLDLARAQRGREPFPRPERERLRLGMRPERRGMVGDPVQKVVEAASMLVDASRSIPEISDIVRDFVGSVHKGCPNFLDRNAWPLLEDVGKSLLQEEKPPETR